MNLDFYVLVFISLLNLSLSIFILSKNYRKKVNLFFSLAIFSIAIWTFGVFIHKVSLNPSVSLFGGRLAFVGGVLLAWSFLLFTFYFIKSKLLSNKFFISILWLITLFFIIASITPLIVKNVTIVNTIPTPVRGYLYPLFALYFLLYIGFALIHLIISYRSSKGNLKIQIQYVFTGFLLSSSLAVVTNIIFPQFLKINELVKYGPYASIILIGFTGYAILRYRLMDIRLIIKKQIIYPILLILVLIFYTASVMFVANKLIGKMPIQAYIIYFATIFFGILIFNPIRKSIYKLVDRYLLPLPYDRAKVLKDIEDIFKQSVDFNININLVIKELKKQISLKRIAFLMYHKKLDHLFIERTLEYIGYKNSFRLSNTINKYLEKHHEVLVYEEIKQKIEDNYIVDSDLEKIKKDLLSIEAYILVPIILKQQLAGLLILGEKKSGDGFSVEDIKMLNDIAYHIGSSIVASKLYRQVESQRSELERNYEKLKKVMDLTVGRELKIAELKKQVKNKHKK
jgi:hypothetical protein